MHIAILNELTRAEWKLEQGILKKIKEDVQETKLNLLGALYPHELKGTIFYLADIMNYPLFTFLTKISDSIIVPINPEIDLSQIKKRWDSVDRLLELWDGGDILPMLSHRYEDYVGKDFLDPLLEKQPPCGAVRSNILLRKLVGSVYDKVANIEHKFMQFMPGSSSIKTLSTSILTELKVLGHSSLAKLAEISMGGNFKAGYILAQKSVNLLTAPTVSGFGSIAQYRVVDPFLLELLPWGATKKHEIARNVLSKRLDPRRLDNEELKNELLELDKNCKKGINSEINNSLEKINNILSGNSGPLILSVYMGKGPAVKNLTWINVPLIAWDTTEGKSRKDIKLDIKEIRPGDSVRHPFGTTGTLGGFALNNNGSLVPFTAQHVSTAGYTTDLSALFFGKQENKLQQVTFNLRIRGLDEDLPAVLKKPIQAKEGMKVIMIGWRSGPKKGVVLTEKLDEKSYIFEVGRNFFSVSGSTLFTASFYAEQGDSGALILSEMGRFPVGMVVASSKDDPRITYCHRLSDILPMFNIQGIFCPLGLPKNSSDFFREVIASLVPDGLFLQDVGIIVKGESEVLDDLCVNLGTKKIKKRKLRDTKLHLGDKVVLTGRLALDEKGKIIGIAFATSGTHTVIQPVERIERALNLKFIS